MSWRARWTGRGAALLAGIGGAFAVMAAADVSPTTAEVIASLGPNDWRRLEPENTLYLELPGGRVIIELAPAFAPAHVANVKTLVRQGYFDGLPIVRSQDNYVVQWGDPDGARELGKASTTLPPEFTVALTDTLPFTRLPDVDGYAPEAGFSQGFPAGRDPRSGQAWLAHCYGMVGVGRGNELDSGNGSELYAVTGHAPRHLDRNIALIGRVVMGMERLSVLPRGGGPMGFYEQPEQYTRISTIKVAADLPVEQQTDLEIMRTDTSGFTAYVETRRNRREEWFTVPAGHVGLCNVPLLARPR
jgi:cyclophilin family peptidyl-prolyl cis-trans isomerase